MSIYPGLVGKRVLITAAGDGMGKVTAKAFVANGARVHICDVDEEKLEAFRKEVPSLGVSGADVADPAQVNRMFDTVESSLSGLDVVVNNAGISGPKGPIEEMSIEDWDRTIAVNLNGPFYILKRAVPLLRAAGGGSIVNISSTAGYMGYPFRTPYAASKFGLIGITKSLSIELGRAGIRVNSVCPGPVTGSRMGLAVITEAKLNGLSLAEARALVYERNARTVSLHTMIEPEDIASIILFICSDAGAKISGQTLTVDGDTHTLAEPDTIPSGPIREAERKPALAPSS